MQRMVSVKLCVAVQLHSHNKTDTVHIVNEVIYVIYWSEPDVIRPGYIQMHGWYCNRLNGNKIGAITTTTTTTSTKTATAFLKISNSQDVLFTEGFCATSLSRHFYYMHLVSSWSTHAVWLNASANLQQDNMQYSQTKTIRYTHTVIQLWFRVFIWIRQLMLR